MLVNHWERQNYQCWQKYKFLCIPAKAFILDLSNSLAELFSWSSRSSSFSLTLIVCCSQRVPFWSVISYDCTIKNKTVHDKIHIETVILLQHILSLCFRTKQWETDTNSNELWTQMYLKQHNTSRPLSPKLHIKHWMNINGIIWKDRQKTLR